MGIKQNCINSIYNCDKCDKGEVEGAMNERLNLSSGIRGFLREVVFEVKTLYRFIEVRKKVKKWI